MGTMHYIGGEKGGVGKSLVARILIKRAYEQIERIGR